MSKLNKVLIIVISILAMLPYVPSYITSQTAIEAPFDIEEVLKQIDEMQNFKGDFSAEVTLIQTIPDEEDRVRNSIVYRKDWREKFLTIFTSPISMVGDGYLYVDDNLWYYNAETREFIRKTRREPIGGTDARSKDLEKSRMETIYDYEYIGEGKVGNINAYILYGEATIEDVAYPKSKIWIRQDNYLPIKEESYSVNDVLSQTRYSLSYIRIYDENTDSYTFLNDKRLIVNNLENGRQTLREFTNVSTAPIPDNIFTKAYLENQSQ